MEYRIHIYDMNSRKYFVEREFVKLEYAPQVIAKNARYYKLVHSNGSDLFYDIHSIYNVGLNKSYHDSSELV